MAKRLKVGVGSKVLGKWFVSFFMILGLYLLSMEIPCD